jgi:predicted peroxiredoxin
MANGDRVIVGCTHGEEDPDRVVTAYLTAGAALDQGKDVVMWLTVEGVRLALRGYADGIRVDLDHRSNEYTASSSRRAAASTSVRSASRSAISTNRSSSRSRTSREQRR